MSDVLVIDTSTNAVAVACGSSCLDVSSRCISQMSFHSENILVAINEVLAERKLTPRDLAGIGVGIGPGLFTGLRVGITAAHAFAHSLKIPLVYFSSLEMTVFSSVDVGSKNKQNVMVARDARRHELFFAQYSLAVCPPNEITIDTTTFSSKLNRQINECLISPTDFVDKVKQEDECIFVLDDIDKYEEFKEFEDKHKEIILPAKTNAEVMIDHVIDSVMAGITANPFNPSALYIRKSDAELSWNT